MNQAYLASTVTAALCSLGGLALCRGSGGDGTVFF